MAEQNQVVGCHTQESWLDHFQKGKDSKKLVVVDFTASWCGPCRFIAPILTDLAKKWTDVTFLKVDVDELKEVAEEWKIDAMPTLLFLKEGKVVDKIVGARKEELLAKVEKHAVVAAA
ncbi:Thioredoxin [Parasponia andersonii]|uniref:Thioredoxin n=1 Tax=Parasponia andersonii TaxID=3476 RepID=A0A2P5BT92_PARAD|nr:Thioredoxin [Parasponia andersonii]